ncbi:hypothetical protein JW758_03760 [Candidatus Peregrinibacteria bacterium]|nr:hypothetical protein [Candidatus Peregrinibacteria bacterium]
MHPEEILADPDAFWKSDSAYQLVTLWHQDVSFPIPMDKWKTWIQSYNTLSIEEREKNTQLIASRQMMQKKTEFNEKAIPYLCSFLPKDCPINTTIYFTTAIMASGFQMGNSIVIYGANSDKDNLIIHELFHQGFNNIKPSLKESGSKDSIINKIYNDLQNEGMATYVGYMALKDFPTYDPDPFKDDYGFFQDTTTFKRLHELLNETLKKVPSFITTESGQKEMQDTLWQVGSMDRAYYVIGCYMAQTIDKKLGRQTLIETISMGPQSFLQKYNSLVDEKLKIFDIYSQK